MTRIAPQELPVYRKKILYEARLHRSHQKYLKFRVHPTEHIYQVGLDSINQLPRSGHNHECFCVTRKVPKNLLFIEKDVKMLNNF